MGDSEQLQATVKALTQPGKGLLAADESGPTIAKRFKAIGVESTVACNPSRLSMCVPPFGW